MGYLLCEGDRVLCRDQFGDGPERIPRVVGIERCTEPRSKYGKRVAEVDWDRKAYLNVTLDDGSWAYGDQLEQYDFPLQFRATVERCPEGKVREVLAALRAWAVADEGLADGDVWIDVMGDPGLPTIHTTRVIAKEGRWAAPAELRLRARVTSAGGDGVRLVPTFLRPS